MRLYVAVTDNDWFALHASKAEVEEVNFWRPSPDATFKALQPGELLLFKLHAPDNYIAGGGFFTRFLQLPITVAWETVGEANGARSLAELRSLVTPYRSTSSAHEKATFGCIMLAEPFFWRRPEWIPIPTDFPLNVPGKGYDSETGAGTVLPIGTLRYWLIGVPLISAVVSAVPAGVVALAAIFRRERSILMLLPLLVAAFVLFWTIGEMTESKPSTRSSTAQPTRARE